tara:strand:+ start:95 stop:196 length:102 start_codon:yes stop_codon:yes gene_type:complete
MKNLEIYFEYLNNSKLSHIKKLKFISNGMKEND